MNEPALVISRNHYYSQQILFRGIHKVVENFCNKSVFTSELCVDFFVTVRRKDVLSAKKIILHFW